MKRDRWIKLSGVAFLFALAVEVSTAAPKMRDATTHDELAERLRKAQSQEPMRKYAPSKGEDPSKVNKPVSLLESSDIICFAGNAVLVPKRAILSSPKNYADRLKMQPGAEFRSWSDFYTANRGWITTIEVSRAQAEGSEALEETAQKRIEKSRNLVVAVYKGGPISVLPVTTEVENTAEANTP